MTTLSTTMLNLVDWAKHIDPDGKTPVIAEMLSQVNEMVKDIPYIEGNLPMGHQDTVRTGLPAVAWRQINQGTVPTKSSTAQVTDVIGILEAWSQVDPKLAKLNANQAEFRLSESVAFLEAMGQEIARNMIYGNHGADPEQPTGLAIRYSDLTGSANSSNVLSGGGAGSDNSSIWLIGWGNDKIRGIFPKGSKAGISHEDLGLQTIENAQGVTGALLRVLQDKYDFNGGVSVKDWRYGVRIANIDISLLIARSTPADLITLMEEATYRLPTLSGNVKPVFYMNRTCIKELNIQRRSDISTGGGITIENVDGVRRMMFQGIIPIKLMDQLTEAEATVS